MNLENVKLFYVSSCVLLAFVILAPTLMAVVSFPEGEKFSELWILGSNRMAEGYPFNVAPGGRYSVLLGVGNYMGDLEYYTVYVKLRNQTESFPNSTAGLPSGLEPVFEYRMFLRNNATWEREVSFSFDEVSFDGDVCRVSAVSVDGRFVGVDKVAVWDAERSGFFYQLFFELWIYDAEASGFAFHSRSVGLWLNMSRQL